MYLITMMLNASGIILITLLFRLLLSNTLSKSVIKFIWVIDLGFIFCPNNISKNVILYFKQFLNSLNNTSSAKFKKFYQINTMEENIFFEKIVSIFKTFWIIGVIICLTTGLLMILRNLKDLKEAFDITNSDKIKLTLKNQKINRKIKVVCYDRTDTAFTYGIFKPIIVLPNSYKDYRDEKLDYIFKHELNHIRKFDTLIKLISYCICCIMWFNPLVWIMNEKLKEDIEFACDENVIKNLDSKGRIAYAEYLCECSEKKLHNNFYTAFAEDYVVKRIKYIHDYENKHKKYKKSLIILVIVLLIIFCIGNKIVNYYFGKTDEEDIIEKIYCDYNIKSLGVIDRDIENNVILDNGEFILYESQDDKFDTYKNINIIFNADIKETIRDNINIELGYIYNDTCELLSYEFKEGQNMVDFNIPNSGDYKFFIINSDVDDVEINNFKITRV